MSTVFKSIGSFRTFSMFIDFVCVVFLTQMFLYVLVALAFPYFVSTILPSPFSDLCFDSNSAIAAKISEGVAVMSKLFFVSLAFSSDSGAFLLCTVALA